MIWIIQEQIPKNLGIFIDDGGIKGPRSTYNNEYLQENSLIRSFILEYAGTLEEILSRIEEAGLTISGITFACCVPELDIVGHVVSFNGREISKKKINKVQIWPKPLNKKEVRGFLGLCAYVGIFIQNFSQIASPLRILTGDDEEWEWNTKFYEAFEKLRKILGEKITSKNLDYQKGAGKIKLAVNSSYIAAGAVLTQEDKEGKYRPVLYESSTFSIIESK
ncbi:hypothetical protein O181_110377 [Austropuccinia psidii MF-1]|uniref:Reverse transcriptase/retrotransposon-derived protein RNase H-like domain-containing protein n=1 Tax=Austropuccinia psidii MF-1 TaxID=1389203 RepID=A0A9Q3JZN3_9BASI|nr:hypothetical protein [Austropuccinia psidii MF-1]